MTRLKSVAATPAAEDIGSSEEDRQNLIQVMQVSHMALVYVSMVEALIKLTLPEWKLNKMQGQSLSHT
jgi:hypothetical protein